MNFRVRVSVKLRKMTPLAMPVMNIRFKVKQSSVLIRLVTNATSITVGESSLHLLLPWGTSACFVLVRRKPTRPMASSPAALVRATCRCTPVVRETFPGTTYEGVLPMVPFGPDTVPARGSVAHYARSFWLPLGWGSSMTTRLGARYVRLAGSRCLCG